MKLDVNRTQAFLQILRSFGCLRLYILFLLLLGIYYLVQWPIAAFDTDLWYHLSHGRYIFEHKSLPQTSYFSFISPPRAWVDYYWLFQVLVFKIYSLGQYYGLIFLRAILYLGTVSILFFYFFSRQDKDKEDSFFYLTLVCSLCFLFLLPRFQLIRPHTFSYFFIPCFLYILECKPKKVFYLPILATFWCNLHGIEYPVMHLICFSFLLEFLVVHLKQRKPLKKDDFYYILFLLLSIGAVYFTPHGANLIGIPLISTEYASQYISELRPINIHELLSFQLTNPWPTTFNILLILACIALGISIAQGGMRISHVLLLAGGAVLLTKGSRFIYEFALLSLPLLRAHPIRIPLSRFPSRKKWVTLFVMLLLLTLPVLGLKNYFSNRPKFPLSPVDLPQGVTTFLKKIEVGGFILNHPNKGGYLQWILYPKYKIYMDMDVPFLFTDEDFFMAANFFSQEEIFRKIISKYDPSFITMPQDKKEFKELVKKFPDYTAVFFDQAEVLYINQRHYPSLAAKYRLNIDPFDLFGKPIDVMIGLKGKDLLLQDMFKLTEIYPDCLTTNQILAMFYQKEGEQQKAIAHADRMIQNFPDAPMGYRLKGIALRGLKSYDQAISFLEMALERTSEGAKREIFKLMAYVYADKKEYAKAYSLFKKGIRIFGSETTYVELFDLSSAALLSGKIKEAEFFLGLANKKVPPEDTKFRERIQKQLSRLGFTEGD